jgi:hypothetical protein
LLDFIGSLGIDDYGAFIQHFSAEFVHAGDYIKRLIKGCILEKNRNILILKAVIEDKIDAGKPGQDIEYILDPGVFKLQGDRFV